MAAPFELLFIKLCQLYLPLEISICAWVLGLKQRKIWGLVLLWLRFSSVNLEIWSYES